MSSSAWTKNFDLKPLDRDELAEKANPKGPKSLIDAHESARENHDLAYFKTFLADHQKNLEEEAELIAQAEVNKASKKEKKPKRKSKDAVVEDEDEEMEDVPASEDAKPSKKRKKGDDNEDDEKVGLNHCSPVRDWIYTDQRSHSLRIPLNP